MMRKLVILLVIIALIIGTMFVTACDFGGKIKSEEQVSENVVDISEDIEDISETLEGIDEDLG